MPENTEAPAFSSGKGLYREMFSNWPLLQSESQVLLEVTRKKDLIHEALGFQSCKMQEIQRLEALEQ